MLLCYYVFQLLLCLTFLIFINNICVFLWLFHLFSLLLHRGLYCAVPCRRGDGGFHKEDGRWLTAMTSLETNWSKRASSCILKSGKFHNVDKMGHSHVPRDSVGVLYLSLFYIGLPEPQNKRRKIDAVLRSFFVPDSADRIHISN